MSKQIFTIHFAGGNCYSYSFLNPYLRNQFVLPIELPGRGFRAKEELKQELNLIFKDIVGQIIGKLNSRRIVLYGHSLGGLLAFHVIKYLEEYKLDIRLVVTGNAGPLIFDHNQINLMPPQLLKEEILKLGGVTRDSIENEDFFNYVEPIIRSDFSIAEQISKVNCAAINCPITCMMGSEEKFSGNISNWSNYTNSLFSYKILSGDHFFIYNYPTQIAEALLSE